MPDLSKMDRSFPYRRGIAGVRHRVFCFPYAGSGASLYRDWQTFVPAEVEICAFEPPGRETRFAEPLLDDPAALGAAFIAASAALRSRDQPFVLLGHSLGAMIAVEVAMRLTATGERPRLLMVCGCAAAGSTLCEPRLSHLASPALIQALRELGGVSDAVLAESELLEALMPVIRADFRMAETWRERASVLLANPLPIPILAIAGADDPYVTRAQLEAWHTCSTAGVSCVVANGDHFFPRVAPYAVLGPLLEVLGYPPG